MTSRLIQRKVWPVALRGAHWALALCVVVLALSAALASSPISATPADYDFWMNSVHLGAAGVFCIALLLRFYLLFSQGTVGSFRSMIGSFRPDALSAMLRFYLTRGRHPMPGYYAQNPLWIPLYLLLFLLLLISAVSGALLYWHGLRHVLGIELDALYWLHNFMARVIVVLALLHIAAVVLHDWLGKRYDISAMLHGERIFEVDGTSADVSAKFPQTEVSVKLDDIRWPEDRT